MVLNWDPLWVIHQEYGNPPPAWNAWFWWAPENWYVYLCWVEGFGTDETTIQIGHKSADGTFFEVLTSIGQAPASVFCGEYNMAQIAAPCGNAGYTYYAGTLVPPVVEPPPPPPPPPPETINISGNKYDTLTGNPIEGWLIYLQHPDGTISIKETDGTGHYEWLALPQGSYVLWEGLLESWVHDSQDFFTGITTNTVVDFYNHYVPPEVTRSQTWAIRAAIRSHREKAAAIRAAVATNPVLEATIKAAIRGEPELSIVIQAAVLGEATKYLPIRAAVRGEPELSPEIIAAVGKDFDLPVAINATVQGNPSIHSHLKAAVLGETEKSVGIVAFVVKTRVDHILLEMENLFPQEMDLRSTPNWASTVKDYRESSLSARDS